MLPRFSILPCVINFLWVFSVFLFSIFGCSNLRLTEVSARLSVFAIVSHSYVRSLIRSYVKLFLHLFPPSFVSKAGEFTDIFCVWKSRVASRLVSSYRCRHYQFTVTNAVILHADDWLNVFNHDVQYCVSELVWRVSKWVN